MLIVEGPDLVGKTVLCHDLIERLNETGPDVAYEYAHSGLPPDDWDYYWSYVKRIKPNIVQDRFHLSELAYGTVTRKKTRITDATLRLIQAHLRLCGAFIVVLTGSDKLLGALYADHEKEEMFSLDEITAVNHFFQDMLSRDAHYDIDYSIYVNQIDMKHSVDEIVRLYLERQKHWMGTEGTLMGQEEVV